jgi:mono/diheme cytochrome c family protein
MKPQSVFLVIVSAAFLLGCSDKASTPAGSANISSSVPQAATLVPAARQHDFATVSRGAKLFQQHCAACHGDVGQGHSNWQQPGPDGKYPAPPLNGTGHAWHHPTVALKQVIKQGTLNRGGNMPALGDKLSDEEIDAVIEWFKSKWPDEIYAAWARMDQKAGK